MNHSIIDRSAARFHQWGLRPISQFTHPGSSALLFFLRTHGGESGFIGGDFCVCASLSLYEPLCLSVYVRERKSLII